MWSPGDPLRIAAAQSRSIAGDLAANVREHVRFCAAAQAAGVDLLVFPELSLSGYELPLLARLALRPEDPVLGPLREAAAGADLTVVAGAPLANGGGAPSIGSITFLPQGGATVYRKQHLHGGEDRFAVPGEPRCTTLPFRGESLAHAICADTNHPEHAERAAAAGASLYVAGVLWSEDGYPADAEAVQGYAARLGLAVLVANHAAASGRYVAAGRSAFWAPGGVLVAAAPGPGDRLVVATMEPGAWRGEVLDLST